MSGSVRNINKPKTKPEEQLTGWLMPVAAGGGGLSYLLSCICYNEMCLVKVLQLVQILYNNDPFYTTVCYGVRPK